MRTPFIAVSEEEAEVAAAELDLGALQELSRLEDRIDVWQVFREALSGELDWEQFKPESIVERLIGLLRKRLLGLASALLIPVGASALMRLLAARGSGADAMIGLIARAACLTALARAFIAFNAEAEAFMERAGELCQAITPVLATLSQFTDAGSGAMALSPVSGLCAGMIDTVLQRYALPMGKLLAGVAVAGNLSGRIRLKKLYALIRTVCTRLCAALVAAFTALLGLQGMLTANSSGLAARSARRIMVNILPAVGGELMPALSALEASVPAVQNAVGITGILLAAQTLFGPLLRMLAETLSVRLSAAVLEPIAEGPLSDAVGQIGEAMSLLLGICAVAGVLVIMLIAGSVTLLNGTA